MHNKSKISGDLKPITNTKKKSQFRHSMSLVQIIQMVNSQKQHVDSQSPVFPLGHHLSLKPGYSCAM